MAKILVVEDIEENRDALSRRLERRGFTVLTAANGLIGVEVTKAQTPDLVLMDMNMPLVDGWEATRRLRADAATRPIPVIALTAHGMDGDREKALEAGCDDHHAKPFELPRLLSQIDALLSRGARG